MESFVGVNGLLLLADLFDFECKRGSARKLYCNTGIRLFILSILSYALGWMYLISFYSIDYYLSVNNIHIHIYIVNIHFYINIFIYTHISINIVIPLEVCLTGDIDELFIWLPLSLSLLDISSNIYENGFCMKNLLLS